MVAKKSATVLSSPELSLTKRKSGVPLMRFLSLKILAKPATLMSLGILKMRRILFAEPGELGLPMPSAKRLKGMEEMRSRKKKPER